MPSYCRAALISYLHLFVQSLNSLDISLLNRNLLTFQQEIADRVQCEFQFVLFDKFVEYLSCLSVSGQQST